MIVEPFLILPVAVFYLAMWHKPDADWEEDALYATIRRYQPEAMIINNTDLSANRDVQDVRGKKLQTH